MNLTLTMPRRSRARLALIAFLAAITALLCAPLTAFAAEAPIGVAGTSHQLSITPPVWTIVTGLLMPLVIALVMKASASKTFKGVVGIIAAAAAAIVERATLADGHHVISAGLALDVLMVYGPQLLSYLGLWQHVDINQKIAPTKGLG